MRFPREPLVLLFGHHDHGFLAPPRDELWALGTSPAKDVTEAALASCSCQLVLGIGLLFLRSNRVFFRFVIDLS